MTVTNQNSESVRYGEIDLKELFSILWQGRLIVAAITGFAAFVSVLFALSQPNIYIATALLAPAEDSGSGLSGLMKEYGGLASLAGVSLPRGEGTSKAQLGMELMRSRAFIGDFVERRDILPELLAFESWDPMSGNVILDARLYDETTKIWTREVTPPQLPEPSAQQAHAAFISILGISEDKQTGYISVSIEHQSPFVAAKWVEWLVQDVNTFVKGQDVEEATKAIEYLTQQVSKTALADLQTMFFELIQAQTETVMLAQVRPEYVFKTIDPAVVPEVKSGPNRAATCILGTLFGGIFGVFLVLIRYYAKSD
jgi:uncharacterized protein involved in exopolysaccharide biosynthesis